MAGIRASSTGPIAPSTLASMRARLPIGVQSALDSPMKVMNVLATHRPLRLILVSHADGCASRLAALLAAEPAAPELIRFAYLDEALRHLAHADVDCVLLDVELPEAPGTAGVERVLAVRRNMPIVALTGADDVETVRLIRAGAQDFASKASGHGGALLRAAQNAIERHRTGERLEVERLVREVAAEVRSGPRRRRGSRVPLLGGAALMLAFCAQLVILRHLGGIVLWALFAVAAVVAWRATLRRREGVQLLEAIVERLDRRRVRQGPRGPLPADQRGRGARCSGSIATPSSAAPTPSSSARPTAPPAAPATRPCWPAARRGATGARSTSAPPSGPSRSSRRPTGTPTAT